MARYKQMRVSSLSLLAVTLLLLAGGCQYGLGTRPVASFGDSTLGIYCRMLRGDHIGSDLGAQGLPRVMITRVMPGGPADRAGIRPGALLLKINNHHCRNAESLIRYVRNLEPGSKANVKYYQSKRSRKATLTVARSGEVWAHAPGMSFGENAYMKDQSVPANEEEKGDE